MLQCSALQRLERHGEFGLLRKGSVAGFVRASLKDEGNVTAFSLTDVASWRDAVAAMSEQRAPVSHAVIAASGFSCAIYLAQQSKGDLDEWIARGRALLPVLQQFHQLLHQENVPLGKQLTECYGVVVECILGSYEEAVLGASPRSAPLAPLVAALTRTVVQQYRWIFQRHSEKSVFTTTEKNEIRLTQLTWKLASCAWHSRGGTPCFWEEAVHLLSPVVSTPESRRALLDEEDPVELKAQRITKGDYALVFYVLHSTVEEPSTKKANAAADLSAHANERKACEVGPLCCLVLEAFCCSAMWCEFLQGRLKYFSVSAQRLLKRISGAPSESWGA